MYQKYYTDALVLGGRASGEADKVFTLYTRDFGRLSARARAVRNESSKMRYALQDLSYARLGLVRGSGGWRIAGATLLRGATGGHPEVAAFARIAALLRRLVVGEEANPYLFDSLAGAHAVLMRGEGAFQEVELLSVARILFALGYISAEALSTALFSHAAYETDHLKEVGQLQRELLLSVNKAISETHL